MPLLEVTIAAGRTPAQIRTMIHELHEAVLRNADTRPEHIRVIVREVPRHHWATGDVTLSELDAAHHGPQPTAKASEPHNPDPADAAAGTSSATEETT